VASELTALRAAEVRGRGVGVLREPGWPKGAESGETWCAPSPARVTPLRRSRTPGPKPAGALPPAPRRPPGAGDDAPRGPGSGVRGSHSPRLAPRPPAPSTHGPLARRYLAILGRRPGAARSSQSPVGWRRRGGGPGTTRRLRRLASPSPRAGLLQAAADEGRPAALRELREKPPPPQTRGGNSNGHHYWRDAPAPTAARGGGACTPLGGGRRYPGPGPAPGPAPRTPAGSRPRAPAVAPRRGRARPALFAGPPPGAGGERPRAGLQRRGWCFRGESRREAHLGRSRKSRGEERPGLCKWSGRPA